MLTKLINIINDRWSISIEKIDQARLTSSHDLARNVGRTGYESRIVSCEVDPAMPSLVQYVQAILLHRRMIRHRRTERAGINTEVLS
jgi:hypothetical protein